MRASDGPRYAPGDFEPYLVVDDAPDRSVDVAGGRIEEGRRNDTLFRLASSMRARGFQQEAILAAISATNRTQCNPPLPEDEVRRLVQSASRYEPGPSVDLENLTTPVEPENDSAATPLLRAAERKLHFYTAREIGEQIPEDVEWIVPRYVAKGAVTLIDGKPKSAGKSTFVAHLGRQVVEGERFLGEPTMRTPIVYLTEQFGSTFRELLARADLLRREDLYVLPWYDTLGMSWPEVVREAVEEARIRGAGLLVVDTLPQFSGLRGDVENSAGAALAAVQPIQEAVAAHNLGAVLVRHERKSGGQVGDSGRGSSAFAGAVDIVVSIRRPEGHSRPEIRELHALSRFDDTPDLLITELTQDGYRSLGSRAAVAEAEAREAILDALPASSAGAMSLDELLRATGAARSTAQQAIEEMLVTGELASRGRGVRGDPRRYWRSDAEGEGTETG